MLYRRHREPGQRSQQSSFSPFCLMFNVLTFTALSRLHCVSLCCSGAGLQSVKLRRGFMAAKPGFIHSIAGWLFEYMCVKPRKKILLWLLRRSDQCTRTQNRHVKHLINVTRWRSEPCCSRSPFTPLLYHIHSNFSCHLLHFIQFLLCFSALLRLISPSPSTFVGGSSSRTQGTAPADQDSCCSVSLATPTLGFACANH